MLQASEKASLENDIFISCAAVADYKVKDVAAEKIKKSSHQMSIQLERNPDILATIAQQVEKPFCVGFAAETNNVIEYATGKMQRKNLDMIIANDVSDSSIGFNSNQNAVTVLWPDGQQAFAQMDKSELAQQLIQLIAKQFEQSRSN